MWYYINGCDFMIITSLDNKKIKKYLKLKQKKYRDHLKLFLIEGEHLVKEAIKSNYLVDLLVLEDSNLDFNFSYTIVSNNIMKKLSNMDSIPKAIGICKFLNQSEVFGDKILVLDDVQDPGNLGTIIRTLDSAGYKDLILSQGSAEPYNPKVVRSTMGAIFRLNLHRNINLKDELENLKNKGYKIVITSLDTESYYYDLNFSEKIVVVIGNESKGVSKEIQDIADIKIKIPMLGKTESLNAAVATSIIAYEGVRQKFATIK